MGVSLISHLVPMATFAQAPAAAPPATPSPSASQKEPEYQRYYIDQDQDGYVKEYSLGDRNYLKLTQAGFDDAKRKGISLILAGSEKGIDCDDTNKKRNTNCGGSKGSSGSSGGTGTGGVKAGDCLPGQTRVNGKCK